METKDQKKHRKKNSGPKAAKKKKRHLQDLQLGDEEDAWKRNPKAFAEPLTGDIWSHKSSPAPKDMEMHGVWLLLKCEKLSHRSCLASSICTLVGVSCPRYKNL
uniref:Uncharacterized protein n=1 Tax=Papio anubis TaxID=9555 RepID=A0A8I5R599_PAPAN